MSDLTNRYVLAPYVRAGFQKNTLFFGFGSIQRQITHPELADCLLAIASRWREPATSREIGFEIAPYYSPVLIKEAMELLHTGPYLVPEGSYQHKDRYSRHALFYQFSGSSAVEVQCRIEAAHVIVLGCGGIGNQMAAALATAGIGALTLVDNDTIELSNLTRQILFTEEDEGASKTLVLQRELQRRSSRTRVETLEMRVERYEDLLKLPKADLIILSADLPAAVSWVNRFSLERRVPFLNVGYVNDVAVWGPFVRPGETSCWSCQNLVAREPGSRELNERLLRINTGYQAPSIGPINMMASAHALMDVLRYIGKFGHIESENRRIGVWTQPLKVEIQECPKNPDCPACSKLSRGDVEWA